MPHPFNIFNWANDNRTMAISIDSADLPGLTTQCNQPDGGGNYPNLAAYIAAADAAGAIPPDSFFRPVDVVWLNLAGYGTPQYFPNRAFVATRTGNPRAGGGFATRGYCIIDPQGYPILSPHHRAPIQAEYISTALRDVIVVLP